MYVKGGGIPKLYPARDYAGHGPGTGGTGTTLSGDEDRPIRRKYAKTFRHDSVVREDGYPPPQILSNRPKKSGVLGREKRRGVAFIYRITEIKTRGPTAFGNTKSLGVLRNPRAVFDGHSSHRVDENETAPGCLCERLHRPETLFFVGA